jgi:hypothetical protein
MNRIKKEQKEKEANELKDLKEMSHKCISIIITI